MAEEATVTIFKIGRCGYYETISADHKLANTAEVFADVGRWLNGKAMGDTCTYFPNQDLLFLRTFCVDRISHEDSILFVSWNESDRGVKGVKSINENDAVGSASVKTVSLGEHDIPGYPAFFWIIPNLELVINIRFSDDRQNGSQPFQHYMRSFLYQHSKWCVFGEREEGGEVPILGYSEDLDSPKDLESMFDTFLDHRGGEVAYLRENCEKIIRLVRKKYFRVRVVEDKDLMTRLLLAARVRSPKVTSLYNKVRYEIPFKPTLEKLNELISDWIDDDEKGDVGFRIKGESGHVYWLGRTLSRDKIDLEVRRKGDGMIDSASLMEELTKRRDVILSLRG